MLGLIFLFVVATDAVAKDSQIVSIATKSSEETELVTVEEFPYVVSVLLKKNIILCGGTIISSNRILTTAYCTFRYPLNDLIIRAGTSFYDQGVDVQVISVCTHPQFILETLDNDVAVLTTISNLKFGPTIQAIELASIGSTLDTKTVAVAVGWKIFSPNIFPTKLQTAPVSIISQHDCKTIPKAPPLTDSMTCYYYIVQAEESIFCKEQVGTTSTGGPLVIGRTQVGIASQLCGSILPYKPAVYTNVSTAIIRNHILSC